MCFPYVFIVLSDLFYVATNTEIKGPFTKILICIHHDAKKNTNISI